MFLDPQQVRRSLPVTLVLATLAVMSVACGGGPSLHNPPNSALSGQLRILTSAMTKGYLDRPYRNQLAAAGGSLPYTWVITQGSLPPGLEMDSTTGEIAGTPNSTGRFYFTAEVRDSSSGNRQLASQDLVMTIGLPPVAIRIPAVPQGDINKPYRIELQATGGVPPYSWAIVSGALPPGLHLDPVTGIISGTPRNWGTFGVTIQVTDSSVPQLFARMTLGAHRGPE